MKKIYGARPTNPYIFRIMSLQQHPFRNLKNKKIKIKKNVTLPEKKKSYWPKTLACRHNLTLQITWGGSHMATPLLLCV